LKATVTETDKSRELIVRELTNMKDVEADRIRSIESKKEAEVKMLEKIIASMKLDKKELE
jgi:hypothetical protein